MDDRFFVRKPLDAETGIEVEKCSYALFPGRQLAESDPEIVVKLYDSLKFQYPDLGIFLCGCDLDGSCSNGVGAYDGEQSASTHDAQEVRPAPDIRDAIISNWDYLGRPTLIIPCASRLAYFEENFPEIPVVLLYGLLLERGISGGCHEEEYCLYSGGSCGASDEADEAVHTLAEDMGVTLVADDRGGEVPYLTHSIAARNELMEQGHQAVHILELIYGMRDSLVPPTPEQRSENYMDLISMMQMMYW